VGTDSAKWRRTTRRGRRIAVATTAALTAGLSALGVPAAALSSDTGGAAADQRITAIVQDRAGIAVNPDGSFSGVASTARVTVTRTVVNGVEIITVVPR
jgi:hypothetical protein